MGYSSLAGDGPFAVIGREFSFAFLRKRFKNLLKLGWEIGGLFDDEICDVVTISGESGGLFCVFRFNSYLDPTATAVFAQPPGHAQTVTNQGVNRKPQVDLFSNLHKSFT